MWNQEKIPKDSKTGAIIKIPKKGNLNECQNWREITLLSIPYKIYRILVLNRISKTVNTKLRENQCGFRANRSCIDQIFTLRNILERAYEWRQPIITNFIDFEKAFDSIDHDSLWQIMAMYGIPKKIINIVKEMYTDAQYMIKMKNTLTQKFNILTGVRQGCVLSPLLFNLAMDFVLRNTKELNNRINWRNEPLSDLDFADDICLLHNKIKELQKKHNGPTPNI